MSALRNYMVSQRTKTAQTRSIQASYRRQARFWAALEDPDVLFGIIGFAFVGGVCIAGLIGFLMPI